MLRTQFAEPGPTYLFTWEAPPNFAIVTSKKVYRSGQPSVTNLETMREKLALKSVLNMRLPFFDPKPEEAVGIQVFHDPVTVWNISEDFIIHCLQTILNPANQPILVRCRQGADRTGALCAAYRIAVDGWPISKAIVEAKYYGLSGFNFQIPALLRKLNWERVLVAIR